MKKIFILLFVLSLLASPVYAAYDYTADGNVNVAYPMKIDEDPIQDASTNSFDVDLKGAGEPNYDADAPTGYNAGNYDFDGSDDYACNANPSNASMPTGAPLFASAWVFPDTISGSVNNRVISYGERDGTDTGFAFGLLGEGTDELRLTTLNVKDYNTTTFTVVTGEWQFIAASMDASFDITFYHYRQSTNTWISELVTHNADMNTPSATSDVFIGALTNNDSGSTCGTAKSSFFDGHITEPNIFDRVFSFAEVQELMIHGLEGTFNLDYTQDSNCQGAWLFTEGSGTTVADSSQNSNTGDFRASGEPAWDATDVSFAVSGSAPNSADFDGSNDYIDIGASSGYTFATAITMTALAQTDSNTAARNIAFRKTNTSTAFSMGVDVGTSSTNFLAFYRNSSNVFTVLDSGIDIVTGGGYHSLAVTASGTTIKTYVDGVAGNTASDFDVTESLGEFSADKALIGAFRDDSSHQTWDGKKTETSVFDRELSITELNDIYDFGLEGVSEDVEDTDGDFFPFLSKAEKEYREAECKLIIKDDPACECKIGFDCNGNIVNREIFTLREPWWDEPYSWLGLSNNGAGRHKAVGFLASNLKLC